MSFFQNVFDQDCYLELQSNYGVSRQSTVKFKIPRNQNTQHRMISWNSGPYDFSSDGVLKINFAIDSSQKNYATISVDVSGATPGATTAHEVADALNANATFADRFTAEAIHGDTQTQFKVAIFTKVGDKKPLPRVYISNTGAETKLRFNRYAGVAEAPVYFHRHTIDNRFNFADSLGHLIALSHVITGNTVANPTVVTSAGHGLTTGDSILIVNSNSSPTIDGTRTVTVVDENTFTVAVNVTTAGTFGEWMSAQEQTIISDEGFTPANLKTDWELNGGKHTGFMFKKQTIDGSNRVTELIEYPAGSVAGDPASRTVYTYSGANTNPSTVAEMPWVLRSGDLITPS